MLKAWQSTFQMQVTPVVPKLFVVMTIIITKWGASLCSKLLDERGVTMATLPPSLCVNFSPGSVSSGASGRRDVVRPEPIPGAQRCYNDAG
eukprot:2746795-Prymnesium_polylepis.1